MRWIVAATVAAVVAGPAWGQVPDVSNPPPRRLTNANLSQAQKDAVAGSLKSRCVFHGPGPTTGQSMEIMTEAKGVIVSARSATDDGGKAEFTRKAALTLLQAPCAQLSPPVPWAILTVRVFPVD